jgi:N-acyl-D-amino-acid deacylase
MHHPFTYGWVARVLGRYVREKKLFSLEEAIRKMTSFPARKAGLRDRGMLREGLWADVVVLNEAQVQDNTTVKTPDVYPSGFQLVLVNGRIAFDGNNHTGALNGTVIRA